MGHGTDLNENSAVAAKREVDAIAGRWDDLPRVHNAYMEEAPLIAEWDTITSQPECGGGALLHLGWIAQL